jgi:hypothetical protein
MQWVINGALPHAHEHTGGVLAHAPANNEGWCHLIVIYPFCSWLISGPTPALGLCLCRHPALRPFAKLGNEIDEELRLGAGWASAGHD